MFHRNHSQFCNDRMGLIVACSLMADVGLSCLSASFTITTNYSVCLECWLLIIVQHLCWFLSKCSNSMLYCKVLGQFYQQIVVINNKDTNELIYFEKQFIVHYVSTNVALDYWNIWRVLVKVHWKHLNIASLWLDLSLIINFHLHHTICHVLRKE
jgi:hypothetical protein